VSFFAAKKFEKYADSPYASTKKQLESFLLKVPVPWKPACAVVCVCGGVCACAVHSLIPSTRDAHNGYLWLRENENKFEKKVYGPVALEVCTKSHH
jgi:hypothetical protein